MDPRSDYRALVRGVREFQFGGDAVPCQLLLTGSAALPVSVNNSGQVLIAATRYGRGRVVVLGHEGYLQEYVFQQFLQNAVSWLKSEPGATVGVCCNVPFLPEFLSRAGWTVQSVPCYNRCLGVYCCNAYDDQQAEELVRFVREGGGLLIGGQAWHWSSQNPGADVLQAFPGNKVTGVFGIYFTSIYGDKGTFSVPDEMPCSSVYVPHMKDITRDLSFLLDGVTDFRLDNSSVPSALLVHGSLAFPIAQDGSQRAFLAAAHYGKGRVVVASHETQLSHPPLQNFILNAVRWLDAGSSGKIGVHKELTALYEILERANLTCELSPLKQGLSVYCCTSYHDRQLEEIQQFVAEGGGLLIGGQAWWWSSSSNGVDPLVGYPGNKILNQVGIGILASTIEQIIYRAPTATEASSYYHFRKAMSKVMEHLNHNKPLAAIESSWMSALGRDTASFLTMSEHQNPQYLSVLQELTQLVLKAGIPQVSEHRSVKEPAEKMLLNIATELYKHLPNPEIICRGNWPQKIPAVQHISVKTVQGLNEGDEAWRSTGLYVSPWKQATVCVPSAVVGKGWQVQVGCHTDDLSRLNELKRAPVVTRRFSITAERVPVSSLWGGLLYVIVPRGSQLGQVEITVEDAVMAPFFRLGETSVSQWRSSARHCPAPWAELEADSVILTVPSDSVRSLDDPTPLLSLWNRITKGVAKLAATEPRFPRQERIVADVQISAGWMHSGYPIMIHLESVKEIADLQHMKEAGMWGPIHEMGHNQQRELWDIRPHTTEATCNLWSVYIHEEVLGIPRHKAHEELRPHTRKNRIKDYVRQGATLEHWHVWTALETYLQLQEGFGWKPYMQLFSDYQEMSGTGLDNKGKMNLWAERFSLQVKRNLAPFFRAWGWPIEEPLAAKLAALPAWEENPMSSYT